MLTAQQITAHIQNLYICCQMIRIHYLNWHNISENIIQFIINSIMNQEPIHLGQKKIQNKQDALSIGKGKSQNGGGSTNMSDGSNDTFDEELGHKKGQKFEFINQKTQNWPQWSISQQSQTNPQQLQNDTKKQQTIAPDWDDDFMYCRGMTPAMRKKMKQRMRQAKANKAANKTQNTQQVPKKQGLIQKMKNWFGK